jgi:hypothetical protein
VKYPGTHTTRQNWPASLQAGVGLLLLLYVTAFLIPPGAIPHTHHEEDLHTGDSCLKDACHIAIFHPGAQGGCTHKYHFTKAAEDCSLCHVIVTRQIASEAYVFLTRTTIAKVFIARLDVDLNTLSPIVHNDRGPPSGHLI